METDGRASGLGCDRFEGRRWSNAAVVGGMNGHEATDRLRLEPNKVEIKVKDKGTPEAHDRNYENDGRISNR